MEQHPVVLFDGVCNFCNGAVNLLIQQDKEKTFRFAPLQSAAGQALLAAYNLPLTDFGSFVFIENNTPYTSSTAVLHLGRLLPWYWQWLQLGWLIPEKERDALYQFVANKRYEWFGKSESCAIPTPEIQSRFL